MDMYEIVIKLIGNIEPYGDTNIDRERIINLDDFTSLTYKLVSDLTDIAILKNRPEKSIKNMGKMAYDNLLEIRNIINETIESEE